MGPIVYLMQVSACLGIFYLFYYAMLSRLTFFTINRWYLVVTLVLSFVIPLLTITIKQDTVPIIREAVYVNQLQIVQTQDSITIAPQQIVKPKINWIDALKAVYLLTVLALFIKLVAMLISFFAKLKRKNSTRMGNVYIIHRAGKLNNGSFLNYIFLNDDELSEDEIRQIIEHEILHVKLYHSVDRILAKLAQIVLWFNPFVYLYVRVIEENHEFEVDREVGLLNDKSTYADMLLHLSVARQGTLYNSFSMVPLKKRITMLFTKPTNHMKKVIYLLALPVVMLSCVAFARLKHDLPTEKYSVIAGVELSDNITEVLIDGKNYDNDVLYKISASCIKSVRVKPLDPTKIINGKWVDVKVNIQTKNGDVVYMTETEKENLVKERRGRSTTSFYSRISLTDNDGKPFDKVMVSNLSGETSSTIRPEDKVGFVINGVFYNENDIRVINEKVRNDVMINGTTVAVRNAKPGEYAKGFTAIFTITTIPVVNKIAPVQRMKSTSLANPVIESKTLDTNKFITATVTKNNEVVGVVKLKTDPKDLTYAESVKPIDTIKKKAKLTPATKVVKPKPAAVAKPAVKAQKAFLLNSPATAEPGIRIDEPFFERTRIVYADGKKKDKVTFHLSDGSASASLGPDDKIGAFIDDVFYDEEALKRLPTEKAKTLTITHYKMDNKKIPDGPYAIPFNFATREIRIDEPVKNEIRIDEPVKRQN